MIMATCINFHLFPLALFPATTGTVYLYIENFKAVVALSLTLTGTSNKPPISANNSVLIFHLLGSILKMDLIFHDKKHSIIEYFSMMFP